MIKSWIEHKLRAFFRPPWEAYVSTGNSLERKARIREMLEKEKILKELAEADLESRITLDPGTVRQIKDTGRSIRQ